MLQRYLGEIGIELAGEDHRHRGVDAPAHLHLRHDERRLARVVDTDEGVWREAAFRAARKLLRLIDRSRGKMESEQESTRQAGFEEAASRGSHHITSESAHWRLFL